MGLILRDSRACAFGTLEDQENGLVVGRFIARLSPRPGERSMRHVRRTAEVELLQAGVNTFLREHRGSWGAGHAIERTGAAQS